MKALLGRFEREAQATATLHCANTVELYDFGVTDTGIFYYAMEFLEGLDAESLVKRFGPLPANRAVFLLRQICESLEDAHFSGLVHRDIKPGNIYICRYGRKHDFVKVLDFGLVKSRLELPEANDRLTQAGTITGTPAYVAPEVALSYPDVDARADLYSLGCTAYWLLTGKPVFEGKTAMEIILQHVHKEPIPPSQVTEMPIPADLEALVLSCLEKEPAKRPSSAIELKDRLACVMADDRWSFEQAERWWKLHQPVPTASELVAEVARSKTDTEATQTHVTAFQVARP